MIGGVSATCTSSGVGSTSCLYFKSSKESKNNMSNEQRNREIFNLKESGLSYSQIGSKFNLSRSRIRQICIKEQHRIKSEKLHDNAVNDTIPYTFWDALIDVCETKSQAMRISNCLNRAGIIHEIEYGGRSLDSYSNESLLSIRNFGTISLIFARRANKKFMEKRSANVNSNS